MATVSRGTTYGATETITNTKLHNLVDLASVSQIVNADCSASMSLVDTKLADITTLNKVRGIALGNLASIPSGAGLIPTANIPILGATHVTLASIPNTALVPISLTSWVDGSAMRNIQSMPSLAGQLAWYSIVSSLASGATAIYDGSSKFVGTPRLKPVIAGDYFAGGNLSFSNTSATSATKVAEVIIPRSGILRIKFWLGGDAGTCSAQIYRNGVAVGTLRSNTTGASAANYSEDISGWIEGDLCQIYAYNSSGANKTYVLGPLIYEGSPQNISVDAVSYLQPIIYFWPSAMSTSVTSSAIQTVGKVGDSVLDGNGGASTTLYIKTGSSTWTAK